MATTIPTTFKTVEQAVADMLRWHYYRTGTKVDTTPGGILRTIFESVGFELEQQSHAFDAALRLGIPEGVFAAFGYERQPATKAQGLARFARSSASAEAFPIPAGAQVSTSGGVFFRTLTDSELPIGATTVDVLVQAVVPGTSGNAPADTVTTLNSLLPGIETVTNPSAMIGGQDAESLESQMARFALYLATLFKGTLPALTAAALAVSTDAAERADQALTVDTYLDDDVPLAQAYVYLYRQGGVSQDLMDAVTAALDAEHRPVGITLYVMAVEPVSVDVTATVRGSNAEALTKVSATLDAFFDSIAIGEDVDYERLIATLADADDSIYKVSVTTPAATLPIARYQRAEKGTVTLTFAEGGAA